MPGVITCGGGGGGRGGGRQGGGDLADGPRHGFLPLLLALLLDLGRLVAQTDQAAHPAVVDQREHVLLRHESGADVSTTEEFTPTLRMLSRYVILRPSSRSPMSASRS